MQVDRTKAIRERAYSIWQREGQPHGKALEHWLHAETEIDAELRFQSVEVGQSMPKQTKGQTRPMRPRRKM
jgi:hypothetical protein